MHGHGPGLIPIPHIRRDGKWRNVKATGHAEKVLREVRA